MAAMPENTTGPPFWPQKVFLYIVSQISSVWSGFIPTISSARSQTMPKAAEPPTP